MAVAERLACFDLDNTLIDRNASFVAWAEWWVPKVGLGPDATTWLTDHDEGGFKPREVLFAGVRERFGVEASVDELVAAYDREHPLFTWVEPEVLDGIGALRTAGWRVAVVTNGGVVQQSLKLEHTGIDKAVDYCCISEAAGVRKPDRRIFEIAAEGAGSTLGRGWMVGDHPAYDVAGGINAGLRTIRIGDLNGTGGPVADHQFGSVLDAFGVILAS
ncbi:HAD-superfamily hydrolase, subfamily IA, variant 1 [Kribbella flavida DSM 17836]|uniref:HAD-superfamily hydrolase, subfamily IA, variant 1 n=1 Tax=Kribbella flavida (strain DSM 17836 / JCM 10339 / NBRC 14399) TaxID=479435 RepID=D2PLS3_KRIFD|nr:HAD family hydrolase [Kribbella flavida]ADB32503.1 HAD-superfamily hydrolase, subfamily IA, variant 1 [Kribbella flavida DSM 17836]